MIHPGHVTGVLVWRIAPTGTTPVLLESVGRDGDLARVSSKVGSGWAKKPMKVNAADLFDTRSEARAEYQRRRAAAVAADPHAYLNFTTKLEGV